MDRSAFYEVFTTRASLSQSSALASSEVRRKLLDSSEDRSRFENGLLGQYTSAILPSLFEDVYRRPYDKEQERRRIFDTRS